MSVKDDISISVIKRLPRYYRFLQSLKENGIVRISSKELAARMGLTASQIRHDFNCFGGFGQQGYGYNVKELRGDIYRTEFGSIYLGLTLTALPLMIVYFCFSKYIIAGVAVGGVKE